jgi:hypothetical protein
MYKTSIDITEEINKLSEKGKTEVISFIDYVRYKEEKAIAEKKYYSVEEVAGENWEDGLEDVKDEWE